MRIKGTEGAKRTSRCLRHLGMSGAARQFMGNAGQEAEARRPQKEGQQDLGTVPNVHGSLPGRTESAEAALLDGQGRNREEADQGMLFQGSEPRTGL